MFALFSRLLVAIALGVVAGTLSGCATSGIPQTYVNEMGSGGLLRTPSARMMPVGFFALTGSGTNLDRNMILTAQVLPRLELALRQSEILQDGKTVDLAPGLDGKLTLTHEKQWWPEVAVGVRSLSGASRRSGEYIVANKRYENFDFSWGLGWGAIAGRDRSLSDSDGTSSPHDWFRGKPRFFGGVQAATPVRGLSLMLEYDPDDRARERFDGTKVRRRWPVNAGVAYRPVSWLEGSAAFEQGERVMLRFSLLLDSQKLRPRDAPEGPPPAVIPKAGMDRRPDRSDEVFLSEVRNAGVLAEEAILKDQRAVVWLSAESPTPVGASLGRAFRVMANKAPARVKELTVVLPAEGLQGPAVTVMRGDIRHAARFRGSAEEVWRQTEIANDAPSPHSSPRRSWDWHVKARLSASPFEGAGPYLYRVSLDQDASYQPIPGLIFSQGTRTTLASNLENLYMVRWPADRPTRSDLPDYAWPGATTLEHLSAHYLFTPVSSVHARVSAGFLEEMFGGVEGEVLYQPIKARWAVGLKGAHVWKREPFGQGLMQPGSGRTTAFGTVYYEHGDGEVTSALSVGQYLGGDKGVTLDLDRALDNGVRLSTSTTWSRGGPAEKGKLDFGLAVHVPFGPRRLKRDRFSAEVMVQPLARDNGQRLEEPFALKEITARTGYGSIARTWKRLME